MKRWHTRGCRVFRVCSGKMWERVGAAGSGGCVSPCVVCVYESVSVGACVPVVYVYACRVLIVGAAPRCRWSNAGWQETRKDREREGGREVVREADKRKRERGEEAWCRRRGENRRRKDHEYRWEKRGKLGAFAGEFLTPGSFSDPIKCRSFLPPQSNFFPLPLISASLFLWPPPTGTLEGGRRWLFRDDWSAEGGGTDGGIRSLEVEQCVEQN